jgi:hypothetical protein
MTRIEKATRFLTYELEDLDGRSPLLDRQHQQNSRLQLLIHIRQGHRRLPTRKVMIETGLIQAHSLSRSCENCIMQLLP